MVCVGVYSEPYINKSISRLLVYQRGESLTDRIILNPSSPLVGPSTHLRLSLDDQEAGLLLLFDPSEPFFLLQILVPKVLFVHVVFSSLDIFLQCL